MTTTPIATEMTVVCARADPKDLGRALGLGAHGATRLTPAARRRNGRRPSGSRRRRRTAPARFGLLDELRKPGARAVDAEQIDQRRLAVGRILAGGLAERRGVALDVEQVVGDLERLADHLAVAVDAPRAWPSARCRGSRPRRSRISGSRRSSSPARSGRPSRPAPCRSCRSGLRRRDRASGRRPCRRGRRRGRAP